MIQKLAGIELAYRTFSKSHTKLPRVVQLAINSNCNMTCKMCPRDKIEISNTFLPLSEVKNIIDRLRGVNKIALVGIGEPFLHPNLFEIIKYCTGKGLNTQVTTNGSLLKKEKMLALINSGLDNLAISMESLNINTEHGHSTSSVAENLKQFIEFKNKIGSTKPYITVQIVLLSEVIKEIPSIVKWAKSIGIEHINLSRANIILMPNLVRPTRKEEQLFSKVLGKLRKKYKIRIDFLQDQVFPGVLGKLYQFFLPKILSNNWCMKWSYYTYILEDGTVVSCGASYPKQMALGNIYENSLKDIWNGEKYKALRKSGKKWNPCSVCDNISLDHKKV